MNDIIGYMDNSETKTLTINPWLLLMGASFIASLFGIIFFLQEHFRATHGVQAIIEDDVMVIFFLRVKKKT